MVEQYAKISLFLLLNVLLCLGSKQQGFDYEKISKIFSQYHLQHHFSSSKALFSAIEQANFDDTSAAFSCIDYDRNIEYDLKDAELFDFKRSDIIFASILERIICFSGKVDVPVRKWTTISLPTVLKMDKSLNEVLHWSAASVHSRGLLEKPVNMEHLELNSNLELSIIFKQPTSLEVQNSIVMEWERKLLSTNYEFSWNNFFWTSENNSFNIDDKQARKLKQSRFSTEAIRDSIRNGGGGTRRTKNDFANIEFVKKSHSFHQQDQQKHQHWSKWKQSTDHLYQLGKHQEYCNWNELFSFSNVKHRKNHVLLRITGAMRADLLGQHSRSLYDQQLPIQPGSCLAQLSALIVESRYVEFVGLSKALSTQNSYARGIVQSGTAESEPFSQAGLNGTGIVIGFSDTGIDRDHCYFRDDVHGMIEGVSVENPHFDYKFRKVIQYVNYSGSTGDVRAGHGSHVAGTLAGYCDPSDRQSSGDSTRYHGMAPAAKLAFLDIGPVTGDLIVPSDLAEALYPPAYYAGARIHSNSWGGGNWYDAYSLETDRFLYDHDDFLAVFAAGNDGNQGMRTVLSPGLAKNAIAVAASDTGHTSGDTTNLAPFSAVGPTADNRLKPDITGPGYSIYSSNSVSETAESKTCKFASKSGTSMAAPVIAGNAALIQQYFRDSAYWAKYCNSSYSLCKAGAFHPSGPLVKALLLHSGSQMSRYYQPGGKIGNRALGNTPDVYQGYGRVTLSSVLPLSHSSESDYDLFVDESEVESFTEMVYDVFITNSEIPLRVTLSWYDPPNLVFAARVLLHDLDLVVERFNDSNLVYYGNAPRESDGSPDGSGLRDEVNNNEQVIVAGPDVLSNGQWRVRVQAKWISQARTQKYALTMTMGGFVVEKPHQARPLDPITFQRCSTSNVPTTNGFFPAELQFSKWSMVFENGWDSADDVIITDLESEFSFGLSFKDALMFQPDMQCVVPGNYEVTLYLSASTRQGTQFGIPVCDVYLTPLHTTDRFHISNSSFIPKTGGSELSSEAAGVVSSCVTEVCSGANVLLLELILFDGGGEGWSGAYYSVQDLSTTPITSLSAASLEWDFIDYRTACIPGNIESDDTPTSIADTVEKCYLFHLSIPVAGTYDYYPILAFEEATYVDDPNIPYEVMEPYLDDSVDLVDGVDCPFYMLDGLMYANLCVQPSFAGENASAIISFYENPVDYPDAYGQTSTTDIQKSLLFDLSRVTKVGVCSTPLRPLNTENEPFIPNFQPTEMPNISPTIEPTGSVSPTEFPTLRPTSNESSPLSLFDGFNTECFTSCEGYPVKMNLTDGDTTGNAGLLCDFFLVELFASCSTYDIAFGHCRLPFCTMNCTVDTLCYFASRSVAACPSTLWSLTNTSAAENMQQECLDTAVGMKFEFDFPGETDDYVINGTVVVTDDDLYYIANITYNTTETDTNEPILLSSNSYHVGSGAVLLILCVVFSGIFLIVALVVFVRAKMSQNASSRSTTFITLPVTFSPMVGQQTVSDRAGSSHRRHHHHVLLQGDEESNITDTGGDDSGGGSGGMISFEIESTRGNPRQQGNRGATTVQGTVVAPLHSMHDQSGDTDLPGRKRFEKQRKGYSAVVMDDEA